MNHVGTQPDGPFKTSYATLCIVMRLLENIYGSGRNITCGNSYMSVTSTKELLKKLTLVGTLRKIENNWRKNVYISKGRVRQYLAFITRYLWLYFHYNLKILINVLECLQYISEWSCDKNRHEWWRVKIIRNSLEIAIPSYKE